MSNNQEWKCEPAIIRVDTSKKPIFDVDCKERGR